MGEEDRAEETTSTPGRFGRAAAAARVWIVSTPALAVLLGALILAGGYAWWQVREIGGGSSADNLAHVDPSATARLEAELTRGLEALFTYDHERPELAQSNADELLRGDALEEWATLYRQFEEQAVGQDLLLSTTVRRVGVRELFDDTATVVVFMDQTSARVGDESASLAAAQLEIGAEHSDGAWRITEIALH